MKLFAILDMKAEAFLPVFQIESAAAALRLFADAVRNPEHQFGRHPEDYHLFELADFDITTGSLGLHETRISLGDGLQFANQKEVKS